MFDIVKGARTGLCYLRITLIFLDSFISGSGSLMVYTVQVALFLCLLSKTVYLYIKGFPSEWWEPVDI